MTDTTSQSEIDRKPIIKNLMIAGSGTGLAQLCMLFLAFILARFLSPNGYGLYAASYAICTLTSFLFNWGLDTWLLRQASIVSKAKDIVGIVITIKILFGVIWALLIVLFIPFFQPSTYFRSILFVCVIDVLCDGLFTAQISYLNSQKCYSSASICMNISRGGRLIFAIILIIIGVRNPIAFVISRAIATIVGLIVITIYAKPHGRFHVDQAIVNVFKDSIPYGFSDLLSAIYLQADVSILALVSGSSKAVGIYSPASGLINALFIIPNAGFYVFLPTVSQLIARNSAHIKSFINNIFVGFSLLGFILTLSVSCFGYTIILKLLGPAYQESGHLLVRLSPLLFMKSIEFGCTSVIVACGFQRYRLGPQIISAVINIILNILLIPNNGVWAVANNYLISEVVLFVGYLLIVWFWWKSYKPIRPIMSS
jgi:O-antigen/teichoic acid export membrane protein